MPRAAIALAVLPLLLAPSTPDGGVDATKISVEVKVLPDRIEGRVRIEATAARPPSEWTLECAPEVEVRSALVDGKPLGLERRGSELALDLGQSGVSAGRFSLEMAFSGSPSERFPEDRGGFVRTVISPEIAHVRSQVAWHPRPPFDAAAWRAVVDAPKGWLVRVPGRCAGSEASGDRARWTFEEDRPLDGAGLVAGPFVRVEAKAAGGASLDALAFPGDEKGAEALLETARRALEGYAARFGPVEARGFTLVEMPEAFGAGSGYGEAGYALLGCGAFRSAGTAAWADSLVAHEVAHTWWGREVGFTTFASESLASYAALGFLEAFRGPDAARAERRKAVAALARASAAGKRVALSEIRPWGRGMDPETYRVHAYEKGMMILQMAEDALGRKAMDAALAAFFARHRGARVDWRELRDALAAAGPAARTILEQGEAAGHPVLTVAHETRKSGSRWEIEGTLSQEGTGKPWKLEVPVLARAGEKSVSETVSLVGGSAKFRMSLPAEPDAVVVDPEARLLAEVRVPGAKDPKEVVARVIGKIANDPSMADPKVLESAIAELRALLRSGAGESEPVCHTGVGRMLFRLGRHGEAKESLERALAMGAGGPFHRAWCQLRLGCIADLEGRREDAKRHYGSARGPGASKTTAAMAERFLEKPYRGYAKDG